MALVPLLADRGVDLVGCSPGGNLPDWRARLPGALRPGGQSEAIIGGGDADAALLARALLRQPTWPRLAAEALDASVRGPEQYERATH